jgi:hypothetical protein
MHPWTLYALEVARDRDRDISIHRLTAEGRSADPGRPSGLRRSVALALAAMSRRSAAGVRRLDDCVADDLTRSMSATK